MEMPLFPWELAAVRGAFTNVMLTDKAQLQRQVNVPTVSGGQTRQYMFLGYVPCRMDESALRLDKEGSEAGANRSDSIWEFTFDAGQVIQATDRIVLNGLIYEPTMGLDFVTSQFGNTIQCRRINGLAAVFILPNALSAGSTTQAVTLHVGP